MHICLGSKKGRKICFGLLLVSQSTSIFLIERTYHIQKYMCKVAASIALAGEETSYANASCLSLRVCLTVTVQKKNRALVLFLAVMI